MICPMGTAAHVGTAIDDPVTVVSTRAVRADRLAEFRDWAARVDAAMAGCPGHIATARLEVPGGIFHLVYHFDTPTHLAVWEGSAAYRALMEEGQALSIGRRQRQEGRRSWFKVPGEGSAAKWRQALMTWLLVLPMLLLLNGALALLPVRLPLPVRLGVSSIIMTVVLTWLILPRVGRWLRPYLLTDGHGRIRESG